MHQSEPILGEHQANSSAVDGGNLSGHHYQQQHSHQQPASQHVGLMSNQSVKTDTIDYNLHRVNDSSMYNQMVPDPIIACSIANERSLYYLLSLAICIFRSKRTFIQPQWNFTT